MFSLTNLLISLFAPAVLMFGLLLSDWIFRTEFVSTVIVLIFFEHHLLGELLGIDLEKSLGSGWIPIPGNPAFYAATAIFDYLLAALVIYVLLTALTKCFFRSKFALPA